LRIYLAPTNGELGAPQVTSALQFALAILLVGAIIWIGDAIAGGIEGALGEKPLRDRDP